MINLDEFLTCFKQSGLDDNYFKHYSEVGSSALSNLPELKELFDKLSGMTFESGLFNIHTLGSFYFWTKVSFGYFKKLKGNSYCFAFDWTGRQYAVNYSKGKTFILMLDPASAEVFEIECDINSFLNDDIEDFKNQVLEPDNFIFLKNKLDLELKFSQCLGFKLSLFLGGKDDLDNYEAVDMEVYWELCYQIYLKTKDLPGDTLIRYIDIK